MKRIFLLPVMLGVVFCGMRVLLSSAASDYVYHEVAFEALLRSEEGATIPCGCCGQTFDSVLERIDHIYQNHIDKSGTYTCKYNGCGKTFTCSCQLRPHIRREHGVEKLIAEE